MKQIRFIIIIGIIVLNLFYCAEGVLALPPAALSKLSPLNGATTPTTVILTWEGKPGAVGYHFCLADPLSINGSCGNIAWTQYGNVTSVVRANLIPGRTYQWGVCAFNADGVTCANNGDYWYFTPSPTTNGNTICVQNGICLSFSQVSDLCTSSSSILAGSPGPAPSGHKFMGNFYDITTCADYTGTISVTIPYNQSSVPSGKEGTLRMFHWENGAWHDVTLSVDTGNNTITGRVNSLSPFVIAYSTASSGGSGSGVYGGTGANENMIALIAILAMSAGVFILRKHRWLKKS
jgi:hypothetical protein